jgi:hypothetical protein
VNLARGLCEVWWRNFGSVNALEIEQIVIYAFDRASYKNIDHLVSRWFLYVPPTVSGFGGLAVSMLASGTQDRGFAGSAKAVVIFFGRKILSMPFFGREVKPFAPCHRFAACQRTL